MSYIYALTDPHGCLNILQNALDSIDIDNNSLYLLGDYIPHQTFSMSDDEYLARSLESLAFIKDLHTSHATTYALMGNHEYDFLERCEIFNVHINPQLKRWLQNLPLYAETDKQIFVHSGIDETSSNWQIETPDIDFLTKHKVSFGTFAKDIISGHHAFSNVHYDGQNHIHLDLNTEKSGKLAILRYAIADESYTYAIATKNDVSEYRNLIQSPIDTRKGF